jgi:hypothetical protein
MAETEKIRRLAASGRDAARREGKFAMSSAKNPLRFGRNPIPIFPVGSAAAIPARAVCQRKSGASIAAPSG